MREIGSEFWDEDIGYEDNEIYKNLSGDIKHTLSGRTAIYYILSELENIVTNKTVYFPAYFCESMIVPFLNMNYQVIYYDITEFLDVTIDLTNLQKSGVLYICDYFGKQTVFPDETYDTCLSNNVIIIHDITMAMFPLKNRRADYLVGSFRKWFGIVCGGLAVSQNKKFFLELKDTCGRYVSLRNKALILKRKYILESCLTSKKEFLELLYNAENLLNESQEVYGADEESLHYLNRYPIADMTFKRLRNYKILSENLRSIKDIRPVFTQSENLECPMFFPLYSDSRNTLKDYLIKGDIFPPIHWPISQYHPIALSLSIKKIYETIISIPCDQRYDSGDMMKIVQAIKSL